MKRVNWASGIIAAAIVTGIVHAQEPPFHKGPLIPEFGPVATIESDMPIPKNARFKVVFDSNDETNPGELNKTLVAAARFLNMHAEAGVPAKNMKLAVVVHGGATRDTANDAYYESKAGVKNANAALIDALAANGVDIYLCGQSAAKNGIARADLHPKVKMSLSAMTAHALLQQQGYAPNPF